MDLLLIINMVRVSFISLLKQYNYAIKISYVNYFINYLYMIGLD